MIRLMQKFRGERSEDVSSGGEAERAASQMRAWLKNLGGRLKGVVSRWNFPPCVKGGGGERKGRKIPTVRVQKRLERVLNRIGADRRGLERVPGMLERQCNAIAGCIESMMDVGNDLVNQSEMLLGLALGKRDESVDFESAIEGLKAPLDFLTQSTDRLDDLVTDLRAYNERIDKLLQSEETLNRTMLPLTYMKALFKIESSSLEVRIKEVFSGVTTDIEDLCNQLSELFGSKFRELESTREMLTGVVARLERQSKSQRVLTAEKKLRIEESVAQVKRDIEISQEKEVKLTSFSRGVSDAINQTVMGVQFHDIVSQKLAHVLTGFQEMGQKESELAEIGRMEAGDLEKLLGFLNKMSRLEYEHIGAIRSDLQGSEERITNGIDEIKTRASEVEKECLSMGELERVSMGMDGIVQVLLESDHDVKMLLDETVGLSEEICQELRPLVGTASNISGKMRQMAAEIHLITLNAQVQAAHVQFGGLEALSAQTMRIARETMGISRKISEDLDGWIGEVKGCLSRGEELNGEAIEHRDQVYGSASRNEESLHLYRDRTLATLVDVGDLISKIHSETKQALSQIAFVQTVDGGLSEAQASLEALAEVSETVAQSLGLDIRRMKVTDLERNYTMNAERAVHAKVMQEHGGETGVETGGYEDAASVQGTGLDEGVDFFDEEPSGGESSAEVPVQDGTVSVEAPEEKKEEEKEGFDNVELF